MHEIGTFPSRACHSGRKQLQSVFLGPFLENNGPVWHSRRPVGPFWLTFGGVWAFLETRPAGTPHLQTQNGPPLATKALKLANHQPIWPPAHGKTPWGLPTPIARHLVWPPNLASWTLCTLIPQQFPLSCPTLRRRHTLPRHKDGKTNQNAAPPHCGGAAWLWFGSLGHNMACNTSHMT